MYENDFDLYENFSYSLNDQQQEESNTRIKYQRSNLQEDEINSDSLKSKQTIIQSLPKLFSQFLVKSSKKQTIERQFSQNNLHEDYENFIGQKYDDQEIEEPSFYFSQKGYSSKGSQNQDKINAEINQSQHVLSGSSQPKKKTKKNYYETKNILQFFWKVLRNSFKTKQKKRFKSFKISFDTMEKFFNNQSHSLEAFTRLFQIETCRQSLKYLFDSNFMIRQIINSGISSKNKKIYKKYVGNLKKGFQKGVLKYLN